jgi:hypothetical protein
MRPISPIVWTPYFLDRSSVHSPSTRGSSISSPRPFRSIVRISHLFIPIVVVLIQQSDQTRRSWCLVSLLARRWWLCALVEGSIRTKLKPHRFVPSHPVGRYPFTAYLSASPYTLSWSYLRATEGWAALQHHAVLRATLTVLPPSSNSDAQPPPAVPNLFLQIKKGSFFTLIPADVENHVFIPEWFSGNIYEVDYAPSHLVRFPTVPSPVSPTVYHLYISGDYEVPEQCSPPPSLVPTKVRGPDQIVW